MVTILDDGDGPLQLFVTADGGTSWGPRSLPAEFVSRYALLRLAPEGRGWLFTLEEPALYVTRDNAATWQRVALDTPLLALEERFGTLWAVAGKQFEPETQRLLRSNDDGLSWQPAAAQPPPGAQLHAIDGQRAFAVVDRADRDQLLYTADGAQSWTLRTLPPHHPGLQLYLATLDADQLWLTARGQGGTRDQGAPGQLYHSSAGGQSWELRNGQGFILPVVPLTPERLFAQGRGPLLRSDDGGVTWDRGLPAQEEWDFEAHVVTDLVFIDAQHGWAYSWPSLFRTTDGGDSWEELPFPRKR